MRIAAILSLLLIACSEQQPARPRVTFDLGARRVSYVVEVADEPAERARGLMDRTLLARDAGMLFVWSDVDERDFYMKDTLISLDLISIRAGRVVGVQHMVPCVTPATADCPTTTTPPADSALEINGGDAGRAGIVVGALVNAGGLKLR